MKKNLLLTIGMVGALALPSMALTLKQRGAERAMSVPVASEMVSSCNAAKAKTVSAMFQASKAGAKKAAADAPNVYVQKPIGSFFVGMSLDTRSLSASIICAPAFENLTWKSYVENAASYEWTYSTGYDDEGENFANATTETINTTYEPNMYSAPSVRGVAASGSDSTRLASKYLQIGGNVFLSDAGQFYNTNIPADNDIIGFSGASMTNDAAGSSTLVEYLSKRVGVTATSATLLGTSETFAKPASPYLLTDVAAHVARKSETCGDVTLTIRKAELDENGTLLKVGDVLCTSKLKSGDIDVSGTQWTVLHWSGLTSPDAAGIESDLVIDSAILVTISLDPSDTTTQFAHYIFGTKYKIPEDHNFLYTSYVEDGQTNEIYLPAAGKYNAEYGYESSFCIQLGSSFEWMHCDDSFFDASAQGETKEFLVYAGYSSEGWDVTTIDDDELPDWLTYEPTDGTVVKDGKTYYTGQTKLAFTAEALPEGETGRACRVKVAYPGASKIFDISQGVTGVKAVAATSAAKVAVVGGDFVITAPEAINGVTVCNVAGQTVATATVDGETTVAAQDLAHGVYVLKFNDGSSVKVIK